MASCLDFGLGFAFGLTFFGFLSSGSFFISFSVKSVAGSKLASYLSTDASMSSEASDSPSASVPVRKKKCILKYR